MSEEVAEQITADPIPGKKDSKKKEKDPKKVAAGKKLAEYNKKAKEALARENQRAAEQMKREDIKNEPENNEENTKAWLPELSFTTVLSIIGIGFTAFDMFMRYRQKEDDKNRIVDLSQVSTKVPPSNIPIHPLQPPKSVGPPPLKMGML